jgi:hypothetical protein
MDNVLDDIMDSYSILNSIKSAKNMPKKSMLNGKIHLGNEKTNITVLDNKTHITKSDSRKAAKIAGGYTAGIVFYG